MSLTGSGRISKASINEFVKGQTDLVYRKNKPLALLKARGNITFNHSGDEREWRVEVRRGRRANRPDGQHAEFSSVDRLETLSIPWGKLEQFERMTKGEILTNKGGARIVNLMDQIIKGMAKDIKDWLCQDFFTGGTDATIHSPLHGLMKFLGKGASGVAYPTPTLDADTYGGKKMALGAYGGAVISGAWPDGSFDPEYHFNTPMQVNYEHATFGAGADWESNAQTAMRRAIDFQTAVRGEDARPDVIFLAPGLWTVYKDGLSDKERIVVNRGDKLGLVSLGFTDMVNFDGVEITSEPLVPQNCGIGLALDRVKVLSLQDQLFESAQDYDATDTKAKEFTIDFYGQFHFEPYSTIFLGPDSQFTE